MIVTIKHPHKCKCVAFAPEMGKGREWWIGELLEPIAEHPGETHCLHLKTKAKDVTFLCNMADFRNLIAICEVVGGRAKTEDWMDKMKKAAITMARSK